MSRNLDNLFLDIYRKAHNNALDLLREAELLYAHKAYARAYAIAYTALEEISKSQFAADVCTGLCTAEEFKEFYQNHTKKLERVQWVHEDANSWPYNLRWIGPDLDDVETINPNQPVFQKRLAALYVDVASSEQVAKEPKEAITGNDAHEIIQLVEVALQRIMQVEFEQGRIGTKGFIK